MASVKLQSLPASMMHQLLVKFERLETVAHLQTASMAMNALVEQAFWKRIDRLFIKGSSMAIALKGQKKHFFNINQLNADSLRYCLISARSLRQIHFLDCDASEQPVSDQQFGKIVAGFLLSCEESSFVVCSVSAQWHQYFAKLNGHESGQTLARKIHHPSFKHIRFAGVCELTRDHDVVQLVSIDGDVFPVLQTALSMDNRRFPGAADRPLRVSIPALSASELASLRSLGWQRVKGPSFVALATCDVRSLSVCGDAAPLACLGAPGNTELVANGRTELRRLLAEDDKNSQQQPGVLLHLSFVERRYSMLYIIFEQQPANLPAGSDDYFARFKNGISTIFPSLLTLHIEQHLQAEDCPLFPDFICRLAQAFHSGSNYSTNFDFTIHVHSAREQTAFRKRLRSELIARRLPFHDEQLVFTLTSQCFILTIRTKNVIESWAPSKLESLPLSLMRSLLDKFQNRSVLPQSLSAMAHIQMTSQRMYGVVLEAFWAHIDRLSIKGVEMVVAVKGQNRCFKIPLTEDSLRFALINMPALNEIRFLDQHNPATSLTQRQRKTIMDMFMDLSAQSAFRKCSFSPEWQLYVGGFVVREDTGEFFEGYRTFIGKIRQPGFQRLALVGENECELSRNGDAVELVSHNGKLVTAMTVALLAGNDRFPGASQRPLRIRLSPFTFVDSERTASSQAFLYRLCQLVARCDVHSVSVHNGTAVLAALVHDHHPGEMPIDWTHVSLDEPARTAMMQAYGTEPVVLAGVDRLTIASVRAILTRDQGMGKEWKEHGSVEHLSFVEEGQSMLYKTFDAHRQCGVFEHLKRSMAIAFPCLRTLHVEEQINYDQKRSFPDDFASFISKLTESFRDRDWWTHRVTTDFTFTVGVPSAGAQKALRKALRGELNGRKLAYKDEKADEGTITFKLVFDGFKMTVRVSIVQQ